MFDHFLFGYASDCGRTHHTQWCHVASGRQKPRWFHEGELCIDQPREDGRCCLVNMCGFHTCTDIYSQPLEPCRPTPGNMHGKRYMMNCEYKPCLLHCTVWGQYFVTWFVTWVAITVWKATTKAQDIFFTVLHAVAVSEMPGYPGANFYLTHPFWT